MVVTECDFNTKSQVECRNEGIKNLSNCDYVWAIDADEFILKADQKEILTRLEGTDHDTVFLPVVHYTRDLQHRYTATDHKPIVLLDPKKVRFYETRCVRFNKGLPITDISLHHMGFTYETEIMNWKDENYWNTGNRKEIKDVLKRNTEPIELPKEIRDGLEK